MQYRLLSSRDMARISCSACNGCGDCCCGMGDTIHLDPYDIFMLSEGLHKSFDDMLDHEIALHADHGCILPHIKMTEHPISGPCCPFLGDDRRCTIHRFRPGLCRLFPLGRDYNAASHSFSYFVIPDGCDMPGKTKVKISSWLGIPDLSSYERFVSDWHFFIRDAQDKLSSSDDLKYRKSLALFILKVFYETPYASGNFYDTFRMRLSTARTVL